MNKQRLTILVLIAAVVGISAILLTQKEREVGNARGMIAQDFTLPMYDSGRQGELSDYRGNIVVMNMWASWCEPCRDEMPALMDFQSDYEDAGVSVITVNMQTFERTLDDASDFIEELNITLPVFFDENGYVANVYQIAGLPATFILDSSGVIEHVIYGEVTYNMLQALVDPMLEER
ncbi:TlpA disulfide reductase family protein [Halalkalibacterium ligniniphilum]|uniref:TlpA disulfide reductase family protein n=1 Tax=Halalkalibacterium ligniniphilum TaxID=1134413 RepID=UPI00034BCBF0|nr:TlpA disulfide reductase family protein [Halalkalibacterium ligniniphilum]